MAKANLHKDRDEERDYLITGNRIITLKLEDDWSQITFYEGTKKLNGEFEFCDTTGSQEVYLLKRMYSPFPGNGLGKAALEFFIDYTGSKIVTRPEGGSTRSDGSHLTEDAPMFVSRMKKAKLIYDDFSGDCYSEEFD